MNIRSAQKSPLKDTIGNTLRSDHRMMRLGLRLIIICQIVLLTFGCHYRAAETTTQGTPAKKTSTAASGSSATASGSSTAAVSQKPADASFEAERDSQNSKIPATISKEDAPSSIEAVAVFYAKRYKGRKTTSGQRYNPKLLTAAHYYLPLGKQVKIVNLSNQKSVVVTVNDRCKDHGYELIDLSREAARQLGYLHLGKARVRIMPLEN